MSKTGYLGNPNLKPAGHQVAFTPEQVKEIVKCTQDPLYFIRTYVKIIHVDKGLIPFRMHPFQEEMASTFHKERFVISMLPRQSGKSTIVAAFFLWYIIFNDDTHVGILANKDSLAQEILGRIKLAYEYLPKWLQQGVIVWNKRSIELENRSKITAAATSSSAIRGLSLSAILLDEFAHINRNIQDSFFASVYPTITSGKITKTFIVSTPKGMDLFYKMWQDAVNKNNDYVPLQYHWSDVPGRDEKWKEETIRNIGIERFEQEYNCTFMGSANTLIHPSKLMALPYKKPKIVYPNGMRIYESPQKDRNYMVLVDTGYGKDQDYSVVTVIDITIAPYEQVAVYRSNKIPITMYAQLVVETAKQYNEAYILVEVNDIGATVAETIANEYEYENLITVAMKGRLGQVITAGFAKGARKGLAMTPKTKRIGCSALKSLIEQDKLILHDYDTIMELSSFVYDGQNYSAEPGYHDDCVMTLVLFGWVFSQKYFKELTNMEFRKMFEKEMEDDELLDFFSTTNINEHGMDAHGWVEATN